METIDANLLTKCNQVVARSHYSADAKEPHVHCRLRFRTVLLKTAAFTCPPKPVRDKVPFVTRSLVTLMRAGACGGCNGKTDRIPIIAECASSTPLETLTPDVIFISNEIEILVIKGDPHKEGKW